jgi:hypothetical protein
VFVDYRRRIMAQADAGMRLSRSLSMTNEATSIQRTAFSPSGNWRWGPNTVTNLSYTYTVANYTNDPVREGLNRDSTNHNFTLSHSTKVDNDILPLGITFTVGAFHALNKAEGDDYDYDAVGGFIRVGRELIWNISALLSLSREIDNYENFNSLAGAGFAFKRRDVIDNASLRLERPLDFVELNNVSGFLNFSHVNNSSNLSFFNYDQSTISAGITARF